MGHNKSRETVDATPEEVEATMVRLAQVMREQPTFVLPNVRDRLAWEESQRRQGSNQRELFT